MLRLLILLSLSGLSTFKKTNDNERSKCLCEERQKGMMRERRINENLNTTFPFLLLEKKSLSPLPSVFLVESTCSHPFISNSPVLLSAPK